MVFVSALADKDTVGRANGVENAGYVVKPFSREKLLAAIEDALDASAESSGTEAAP